MQVYFRLLQEEHLRRIVTEHLGYKRQHLAYAVADVDEVATRPPRAAVEASHLQLKRAALLAEGFDDELVEQACIFAEALEVRL